MIKKHICLLSLCMSIHGYACELIESKEMYGYSSAICDINGLPYKIDLAYLADAPVIDKSHGKIHITNYSGKTKYELTILSEGTPTADIVAISNRDPFDYDNKEIRCAARINRPLPLKTMFNSTKYFDYLDSNRAEKGVCKNSYDTPRSLKEIYDYLDPNNKEGFKSDSLDYGNATISDSKRYVDYLKKYPLTKKTEDTYTQIAAWLLSYGLDREAILLAVNIAQFNPKSINAHLITGDAYYRLKEVKKAQKSYREFSNLAKSLGIEIPKRVLSRI